jgi:phage baseplate assembly protein W
MGANDPTLTDEGFDLLPAVSDPPNADQMLTLQEQLADPIALDPQQDPPAPLGRAPAVDFAQRTFIPNTAGGPLMIYGDDTLRQWVQKCLRTRRGENPACDENFGCDLLLLDLIDGSPYDEAVAAQFEDIVARALSVHPAIDSIEGWSIDHQPDDDAAFLSFTVIKAAEGEDPLDIDVQLPATGAASV